MNAYKFINEAQQKGTQPRQGNFTDTQIDWITKVAEDLDITFENAVMLLVNKALLDIGREATDQFMNPN